MVPHAKVHLPLALFPPAVFAIDVEADRDGILFATAAMPLCDACSVYCMLTCTSGMMHKCCSYELYELHAVSMRVTKGALTADVAALREVARCSTSSTNAMPLPTPKIIPAGTQQGRGDQVVRSEDDAGRSRQCDSGHQAQVTVDREGADDREQTHLSHKQATTPETFNTTVNTTVPRQYHLPPNAHQTPSLHETPSPHQTPSTSQTPPHDEVRHFMRVSFGMCSSSTTCHLFCVLSMQSWFRYREWPHK